MSDKVYSLTSSGRLNIKDSRRFLQMLTGGKVDPDAYKHLELYGLKRLGRAMDVPPTDKREIVNMAIFRAIGSYDGDKAHFLTYFSRKIDGELSDYRRKRGSMMRRVYDVLNGEDRDSFKLSSNAEEEVFLDQITEETPETILFAEDLYRRRLQAFRMAFSGIPKIGQHVLYRLVEKGVSLGDVAYEMGIDKEEVKAIRNLALGLVFTRVLRSKHLDDEEKQEIIKEHGLEE